MCGAFLFLSVIFTCCALEGSLVEHDGMSLAQRKGCFDKVMVPRDGNLLFTSCSDVPKNHWKTRSASEGDDVVSLESLLDRGGAERLVFKKYHIIQIPFKDTDEDQVAVLSDQSGADDLKSGVSVVRKFLVEISDTVANTTRWIVATLVPTPENCRRYGPDSYSYINKETFEGIILYSNLDGSLRSINSYGLRPIRKAQVVVMALNKVALTKII